ncbi:hypothetical protein PoHVEF18_000450 [Penicillium ochrochloron]
MAQSLRLQDKVAIVTGASSGLGRAIAIRYAQEGAKVVCADLTPTARSQEEARITTHDLITQKGGQAIFVQTDVGDATQMENLVAEAVKVYGRLDILVNNAGISIEARFPAVLHLTDEATWDTTMRVNAKSVFLGSKYALSVMLSQEPHASGDRGWIINISSIMGMIAGPENHTQTAIFKETTTYLTPWDDLNRRHPLKGPGFPDDIAKMAVVLASEDASWVTGVCLPVDGGYTAR